jgi:two-component system phosphate regulon sensor histidine kinase PhoR
VKLLKTLHFRLIVSYILVVTFSLAVTAVFLDRSLERHAVADLAVSLKIQAKLIESRLDASWFLKERSKQLDALAKKLGGEINARVTVISHEGKVLGDSERTYSEMLKMENHSGRTEIMGAAGGTAASAIRRSQTLKMDMLYLALPVRDLGFIRLAIPLSSVKRMLASIRKIIALSFVLSALFALIIGIMVISLVSKPMKDIVYASKKFAAGDFAYRINIKSSGELKKLSQTFNAMAGNIELRLREVEIQHQQLKAVFESMVEALIITGPSGVIRDLNPAAGRIFSVSKEAVSGLTILEAFRNAELGRISSQAIHGKAPVSKEIEVVQPVKAVFNVSAAPILERGEVSGCLMLIHDITELRRLERVRRDFVANVSHEIKTPLTAIRGYAETLLGGGLEDKENGPAFLRTIHDQAVRLDNLVNDLLSISYAESGRAKLEKTAVNMKELVTKTAEGLKTLLDKRKLEFENNLPAGLIVPADRDKLSQVLINLLDNAAKFNVEKGFIKTSSEELSGSLKIIVEDSGCGIPAACLSRIFERFYRVDKARSRDLGGTGLGLSIVKHIVELHGGSVGVESIEGTGSKFWFTIPTQ